VTSLLASRIWQRIGAKQDAYLAVDSIGTPFAGGGLSAGLRGMARVGELVLNEGVINGERLNSRCRGKAHSSRGQQASVFRCRLPHFTR